MKTTKKRDYRVVYCEINGCSRPFVFTSPEQLLRCNVMTWEGEDLQRKEYAFVCNVCQQKYKDHGKEDEWQED